MSNQDRITTLLIHILSSCNEITETLKFFGSSYDNFSSNYIFRNAISMPLFNICELVKTINSLDSEFIKNNVDIEWKEIIKMRERFAHHYFSMQDKIIFDTAVYDIPLLKKAVKRELKNRKV